MVVSNIFLFSPLFGEDFQFDEHIFQMGRNHQPVDMENPPLFTGFYTSQVVVWDFNHQNDGLEMVIPFKYWQFLVSIFVYTNSPASNLTFYR